MIYILQKTSEPNPLLPWIYIFVSLSVDQFEKIYDMLDFPFPPRKDLRQIAKDFVIIEEINRGNSVPDAASTDLLQGIASTTSYVERREALFINMFEYLEKKGYAELIYDWGKHTHPFYPFRKVQVLAAWCHLLREWTVLESVRQSASFENKLYSNEWNMVVTKFAPIYSESSITLEPLLLPSATCAKLQEIVIRSEASQLRLEATMDQIILSPQSVWEDFALRHGAGNTWIRLEGHFRINLREWKSIVDVISTDEMNVLEEWIIHHKSQNSNLVVPMPDFDVSL